MKTGVFSLQYVPIAAAGLALLGPAYAGTRTMEQSVRILREVQPDPGLASLPSVMIDSVLATVPLDDRLNADEAFDRPFVDALREGMASYLKGRGLRVADQDADLRLALVIDGYEGWKGWGHWGVDVKVRAKVFRGPDVILSDTLHTLLKYSDEEDVEDEERPKYKARGEDPAYFVEILFTRVGVDLSEKLISLMKERAPLLAGSPQGADAAVRPERGTIRVDASVPNAEVFLNGHLVGTAPLKGLILPAGTHVLEVRKAGFHPWSREIRVLADAASSFVAELSPEARP